MTEEKTKRCYTEKELREMTDEELSKALIKVREYNKKINKILEYQRKTEELINSLNITKNNEKSKWGNWG